MPQQQQQQQLPTLLVVVLLGLLLIVPAGAFSSALSTIPLARTAHRPRQASTTAITMNAAAAATVDCGVIIAGAGPAGKWAIDLSIQSMGLNSDRLG